MKLLRRVTHTAIGWCRPDSAGTCEVKANPTSRRCGHLRAPSTRVEGPGRRQPGPPTSEPRDILRHVQDAENAERWIEWGLPNIDDWIDHIQARLGDAQNIGAFTQAEVIFGLTSVLNRLAAIYYGTAEHLKTRERIIPFLSQACGLPVTVGEALWNGVRNPSIHLGTLNPFTAFESRLDQTKVHVQAVARPPQDPALVLPPEVGDCYALPLPGNQLIGRGWGWLEAMETYGMEGGVINFPYHQDGEWVRQVYFYLNELIVVARHARTVVEQRLRDYAGEMEDGLGDLNMQVACSVSDEVYDEVIRQARVAAVEFRARDDDRRPSGS